MEWKEVVEKDIHYFTFILQEDNTPYSLDVNSTIYLRMKNMSSGAIPVNVPCTIIDAPKGKVRTLCTIPPEGRYECEVEVIESTLRLTWKGLYLKVLSQIG